MEGCELRAPFPARSPLSPGTAPTDLALVSLPRHEAGIGLCVPHTDLA